MKSINFNNISRLAILLFFVWLITAISSCITININTTPEAPPKTAVLKKEKQIRERPPGNPNLSYKYK